jgi:hypothetical protein
MKLSIIDQITLKQWKKVASTNRHWIGETEENHEIFR